MPTDQDAANQLEEILNMANAAGIPADARGIEVAAPPPPDELSANAMEIVKEVPGPYMNAELAAKFESEGLKCLCRCEARMGDRKFYGPQFRDWADRANATVFSPIEVWNHVGYSGNYTYCFVKDMPLPEGKQCLIGWHFNKSFMELIAQAPDNPMIRAHMMKILKVEPPKEIKGYEDLKNWVEATFPRKIMRTDPGKSGSSRFVITNLNAPREPDGPPEPINQRPRGVGPITTLRIKRTQSESGTCKYSCTNTQRGNYEINMNEIMELLEGDTNISWNELMNELLGHVEVADENGDLDFDEDDCDNYHHEDYDCTDTDDRSMSFGDRQTATATIQTFIRQQNPDLYLELQRHNNGE